MAFPVPEHLPRHAFSGYGQSLGSRSTDGVLKKISDTDWATLDSNRVSSWVNELTTEINDTKALISSRINEHLSDFDRQLQSSKDVQNRVQSLSVETGRLTHSLHDPQQGLLPILTRNFSDHRILTQSAHDAAVMAAVNTYLLRCRDVLNSLTTLVNDANLVESVSVSTSLGQLLRDPPDPLPRSRILSTFKHKHRVLTDTVQEHLGQAYSQAIRLDSSSSFEKIAIRADSLIPGSSRSINLFQLFESLSTETVNRNLATLRKSILSKFVGPILNSGCVVKLEASTLTLDHTSTSDPLQNLTFLIEFLQTHLFVALPKRFKESNMVTLITPVLSMLLDYMHRTMPNSLSMLPSYLKSVRDAVSLEQFLIKGVPSLTRSCMISEWTERIQTHYEKKRRQDILEAARQILSDERKLVAVRVEKSVASSLPEIDSAPTSRAENPSSSEANGYGNGTSVASSSHDAHSTVPVGVSVEPSEEEEDGWGFDDDPIVPEAELALSNEDPAMEPEPEEEDPWDDGWEDPSPSGPPSRHDLISPSPMSAPKSATRLEKFATKGRHSSGTSDSPSASNTSPRSGLPQSNSEFFPARLPPSVPPIIVKPDPVPPVKEAFLISNCAQSVLVLCQDIIRECQELGDSSVFEEDRYEATSPPDLLLGSVPSILDLFRALFPVSHASKMALSTSLRVRLYNDCAFLADEIQILARELQDPTRAKKLTDASERLASAGESRFDECLEEQTEAVLKVLRRADGFTETGDETRYAVCESVMDVAHQSVVSTAHDWKATLTPTAYLEAAGYLVEQTLSFVIKDILALHDIPEMESHRLNHLCQRFDSFKDLFKEMPGVEESSVGSHVPSWFKFAYLAELLEASLADITYLFENGALIDFEVDELVRLVKGLFSDTPLRAKTIDKILVGHPSVVP